MKKSKKEQEPTDSSPSAELKINGVSTESLNFYRAVIVLNCGGTISMGGASASGWKPSTKLEEGLKSLQSRNLYPTDILMYRVFDRPPDSTNIGEKEWRKIIEQISELNTRKKKIYGQLSKLGIRLECGGIVIGHGTDTLQTTALLTALEFSQKSLVLPIVFTGSHTPMMQKDSDALKNLKKSIFVAKESFAGVKNSLPPGVYVLIGEEIHHAARLSKVQTRPDSNGRYFFSFPAPVAFVTGTKSCHLKVDKQYISRIGAGNRRMVPSGKGKDMGIVEHLVLDKFSSPSNLSDFALRANYYASNPESAEKMVGLIIQGNFTRNKKFGEVRSILKKISHIPVFLGSKEAFRMVNGEDCLPNIFLIPRSMSHTKAQTKLKWILRYTKDTSMIHQLMTTNVAGEIFDTDELPHWIKYETFPDCKVGTEIVVAYPDISSRVIQDATARLMTVRDKQNRRVLLYLYGFGDGHIPSENRSISSVVLGFFRDEGLIEKALIPRSDLPLASLLERVTQGLRKVEVSALKAYLRTRYTLSTSLMRSAFMQQAGFRVQEEETVKVQTFLKATLDEYTSKNRGIELKSSTFHSVLGAITLKVNPALVKTKLPKQMQQEPESEVDHTEPYLGTLVSTYLELVARRLIKDALMASNPLLSAIGGAVDSNIRVLIRTLAVKSKTNTSLYECGQMLMVLGVHSDLHKGWQTLYLRPRSQNTKHK